MSVHRAYTFSSRGRKRWITRRNSMGIVCTFCILIGVFLGAVFFSR